MRNTLVMIMVFMLLGANLAMTAGAESRTPFPAAVHDLDGNMLEQITAGHQVILSKTFTNDRDFPQPFVALFEVRDSNGVTVYLALQGSTMAANGQANVGVSWIADVIGGYEIRTFAISNMTNPVAIDVVESRSIPVVSAGA